LLRDSSRKKFRCDGGPTNRCKKNSYFVSSSISYQLFDLNSNEFEIEKLNKLEILN
jgi:hypothetical protein